HEDLYLNLTTRGYRACRSNVTYVGPSSFFTTLDPLETSMLSPSMFVALFAPTSVTETRHCGAPAHSTMTTSPFVPSRRIAYRLVGSRSRKPSKKRPRATWLKVRTPTAAGLSVASFAIIP